MTIQEAYLRSLQKNEQNLANGGIKLDPGRFVLLFNEAQDRLVKYYLNRKDDETIRSIQNLLVYWMSLDNAGRMDDPESTSFNLPDDYLWFSNIKGVFSYKGCEATDFVMWEAKNENIHELLGDENNRPSYDYRETFYSIGNGKVVVYESGFRTEEVKMTYYRRRRSTPPVSSPRTSTRSCPIILWRRFWIWSLNNSTLMRMNCIDIEWIRIMWLLSNKQR